MTEDTFLEFTKILINANLTKTATILETAIHQNYLSHENITLFTLKLSTDQATNILQSLNETTLLNIVKTGVTLNKTFGISRLLMEYDIQDLPNLLLNVDPASGAKLMNSMKEINITKVAQLIEILTNIDLDHTGIHPQL
jgi:hypothetical protein